MALETFRCSFDDGAPCRLQSYRDNFVAAGKAVLDVEFFQLSLAFCDNLTASGVDVIVKVRAVGFAQSAARRIVIGWYGGEKDVRHVRPPWGRVDPSVGAPVEFCGNVEVFVRFSREPSGGGARWCS